MSQKALTLLLTSFSLLGCAGDDGSGPKQVPDCSCTDAQPAPAVAQADPDDACGAWGNWRLDYGAFTGAGICSSQPKEGSLQISAVRPGASPSGPAFGEEVHWADGCAGKRSIGAMHGCQLELTCSVEESNPSEHWSATRTLVLTFAGGKATGQVEIENAGFCSGKISAPVTATKLP